MTGNDADFKEQDCFSLEIFKYVLEIISAQNLENKSLLYLNPVWNLSSPNLIFLGLLIMR